MVFTEGVVWYLTDTPGAVEAVATEAGPAAEEVLADTLATEAPLAATVVGAAVEAWGDTAGVEVAALNVEPAGTLETAAACG